MIAHQTGKKLPQMLPLPLLLLLSPASAQVFSVSGMAVLFSPEHTFDV